MTTILAVDGGNSKTELVMCDVDGTLLSHVRGPGCSPDALGVDGSVAILTSLTDAVLRQSLLPVNLPVSSAAFLLAGVDRPEQEEEMKAALAAYGLAEQLVVTNDTFAVLRAGSRRGWGVAVVCGAGLNALGVTPDGVVGRYQALGELSGDWGGGQSVGLAALGAAIRGQDGRATRTLLTELVCRRFEVDQPQAVAAAIHEGRLATQVLVDLAPDVFAAAESGDTVAVRLVARLADEVAAMAVALIRRLALDGDPTTVVLGGGMLQADHAELVGRVTANVVAAAPEAQVHVLDVPPVVGAVRTALQSLASPSASVDDAIGRLVASLGSAGQTSTGSPE